jgi:predicted metal-dependent enzyme (double-stranded beta helix superfamily)
MTASSIDRLLDATASERFASVLHAGWRRFQEYRDQLPLIPYAYTRTRLLHAPDFEIIAMQWAPLSQSPIHDHGTSRCWVIVLEGELEVENFERDASGIVTPTDRATQPAGTIDHRLGPSELHRVRNNASVSAYTLQLYAAPLSTYAIFDEHKQTDRIVTAICDNELPLDL